jgi:uncharacterized protein (TIGR02246 family)
MSAPQTPEECDHQLGDLLAAGALERIVALYEPDATFVTEARETLTGAAAIRAAFAPLAAVKPILRPNLVRVTHVGADLAVIYNDWGATVTTPDGATVEMSGKAVEVMRRQPDGSWRFIYDDPYARG